MTWLSPVTLTGPHARLEPLSRDHHDGLVAAAVAVVGGGAERVAPAAASAAGHAGKGIEPSGPKPRTVSPGRVGLYAFLIVSAIFFLVPLYIMIVTSLKG